jgi:AraC-like DNA-binding protein
VHVYTTEHVDTRRRLDYWSALASDAITPMHVSAGGRSPFEGRLWVDRLGRIDIARAYSSSAVIRRTHANIARAAQRVFLVSMSEEASYHVRMGRCTRLVRGGDLLISDSGEPEEIVHAGCAVIVMRVPECVLKEHLPVADDLTGLIVRGDRGAGLLASTMIRSVARSMRQGFDSGVCEHLAAAVLHSVAAAYAEAYGVRFVSASTADTRRFEITRFVDAHLGDAELTVQKVAAAFGLSDRYLRLLFENTGESLAAYVKRRRLEESARQLRDPLCRSRTVSEIAFSWGFNSLGSYDRAFKARFDVTPRQYRQRCDAGVVPKR